MSEVASLAVIIPAHNAAEFLPVALESVHNQTVRPSDVIVIDDGSTDDTGAVAERAGVRVLRQKQAGPAAARNHGIQEARSEFVAFLDADDWYAPDKIEKSLAMLHELGATTLATDAWLVAGDSVKRRKNENRQVSSVLTKELLISGNPIICSTVVCRRQSVLDVGCFDESPELIATEDYDLWLRLAHREPVAYLSEPLTFYRSHSGGLSSNVRFMHGVDRILAKLLDKHAEEPHFVQLIARRRADVRNDVAYDLLCRGRRAEARALLREARKLSPSWKSYKMWLRSMFPGAGSGA